MWRLLCPTETIFTWSSQRMPYQSHKVRLKVRSREVLKPRDLCLVLSDRSERTVVEVPVKFQSDTNIKSTTNAVSGLYEILLSNSYAVLKWPPGRPLSKEMRGTLFATVAQTRYWYAGPWRLCWIANKWLCPNFIRPNHVWVSHVVR